MIYLNDCTKRSRLFLITVILYLCLIVCSTGYINLQLPLQIKRWGVQHG